MIARIAGTVILSAIVFVVVSLLVSLDVLWWTGGVAQGTIIGVFCGFLDRLHSCHGEHRGGAAIRGTATRPAQRRERAIRWGTGSLSNVGPFFMSSDCKVSEKACSRQLGE
jgi:hypothetical protein